MCMCRTRSVRKFVEEKKGLDKDRENERVVEQEENSEFDKLFCLVVSRRTLSSCLKQIRKLIGTVS